MIREATRIIREAARIIGEAVRIIRESSGLNLRCRFFASRRV